MKIRDLDLDQYVIVYDIGKSENNNGMTVVGRVEEIVFNDDGENAATINSLGNLYDITDDNEFELWTKSIEDKTESVSKVKWINSNTLVFDNGDYANVPQHLLEQKGFNIIEYALRNRVSPNKNKRPAAISNFDVAKLIEKSIEASQKYIDEVKSNDVQQRKRKGKEIDGFKTYVGKVRYNDGKPINDTVNHPLHYNYGDIEVIDFIEQVTQHYNPNVAYHIGNAIKYLARSPHKNGKEDVAKAKWYIERAYDNWDVK